MSGSTDHIIRIYQMTPGPPERIAELDVHNVSHASSVTSSFEGFFFSEGTPVS